MISSSSWWGRGGGASAALLWRRRGGGAVAIAALLGPLPFVVALAFVAGAALLVSLLDGFFVVVLLAEADFLSAFSVGGGLLRLVGRTATL